MNITGLLNDQVAAGGNRAAIIDNSRGAAPRTFTFAQMESAASRVAAQLHASGLRPGDAVLLLQPVSTELYILFTAILRSGLVAMFIDPSAGKEHIDLCCAIHPPKATPNPLLYVGFLVTAVGAAMVLYFRPTS